MRNEKSRKRPVTRYPLLVSVLLLFTVYCLLSADAHALDIQRSVLENGLTLLVVERHNLPIVKVSVGIKAGSIIEPEEKAGLANLTAELLASGTGRRTSVQISEEADFVGAAIGASGGDDYVTVSLSVLKKDLDLGFDLLSDIILNPSFPEDELNKKRERIKGGLKAQEESPGFVASREFSKAVFGSHPYGRLITGTSDSLDRINRDDIVRFHSAYYAPDNAIMSVVGDITPDEISAMLKEYFSGWNSKSLQTSVPRKYEPVRKRKIITVDKDLSQANIIFGHAGISRDDPDYYAVHVMNFILGGGGFGSRLMQNIREQKGLAYDVHSFFMANKYGGTFQAGVQTKNESANAAIAEILNEIEDIRNSAVSDTELADAKSFLTGSFPLRLETGARIANFLIAVEYYGLGMDYIDRYPDYINRVTKEDVLQMAKKYLDPENFVLVVVADQEKAGLKKDW
ncbi:MAG: insulinase family protein [Nitrospiraceae bacterium]|nr:MAG: insulinase family protein [Nitrospiraceae bacterium]